MAREEPAGRFLYYIFIHLYIVDGTHSAGPSETQLRKLLMQIMFHRNLQHSFMAQERFDFLPSSQFHIFGVNNTPLERHSSHSQANSPGVDKGCLMWKNF